LLFNGRPVNPPPIPSQDPPPGGPSPNHLGLERLIFFSDAVFAIAITLLVLDIRLPPGTSGATSQQLLRALMSLWPEYLAFFISFWVIGLSWVSHHRKFLYIRRIDSSLLALNLLMLMLIAFVPFPTAVMSGSTTWTATAFYALTMILMCLSGLALWWYATHHRRLVDPHLGRAQIRRETVVPLATVVIFASSLVIAAVAPGLARIAWILIFPLAILLRRKAA